MNSTIIPKPTAFSRSIPVREQQQQGYSVSHKRVANGGIQGGALRPLNPGKQRAKRNKILKLRLTEAELTKLSSLSAKRGLSGLVRSLLFSPRLRSVHRMDCRHCRLLAGIVNNLNLIARRAEAIRHPQTILEVLALLSALDREIQKQAVQAIGK